MRQPFARLLAALVLGVVSIAAAEIAPAGPEFVVNTYTTGTQGDPSVCRFAAGEFVVVWEGDGRDLSGTAILGQRFQADGTRLGTEFLVNSYTTGSQSDPTICCAATGFVVAWESDLQDGDQDGVFAQRFATDGTRLGTEFQVNTYTTANQDDANVCCDADGGFVVAWESYSQDGANDGVFARRYASTGAPAGGEFQLNAYTTRAQDDVRVLCDAAGNFVAAWESNVQDLDHDAVIARRFASTGLPAGPEFQLNTYTPDEQAEPAICGDDAGNFVVAWSSNQQDGGSYAIIARRYDSAGTALGDEFQVNTYTTGAQTVPSVSCSASGDFVVGWTGDQQDGSGTGIFAQRFDAGAIPHGGEFRVNGYTTGAQDHVAVALDRDGDFVIVWASVGLDGDAAGVGAQRFEDPCGDGIVGAGELCDDGSRLPDGGCCSPTCQAALGAACADDGVACTTDACDASAQCAHTPSPDACGACRQCDAGTGCVARPRTDCRHPTRPRRAFLQLVNKARDRRDRLSLTLRKEAATATADLGTPTTSSDYTLCLFDRAEGGDRLVLMSRAPAGAGWKATGKKGFRYRMRSGAPDGLASIALRSGGAGKAFVGAGGRGPNLRLPVLGLVAPVTAQLEAGGGACFAGTFTTPKKNTATLFRAKGD